MDPEFLRKKLIKAARNDTPSDQAPYAFPKRVMACINMIKPLDVWTIWSRMLWKAAAPCVGITLLFGALSFYDLESNQDEILGIELEETMFSALEITGDF